MSHVTRIVQNASEELPQDLLDLENAIRALPIEHRQTVVQALDKVIESTKRRRRILNLVQDALSQLRLDMKYLMFDLEATRRERDDFRRQLGVDEGQET